MTGSINPQRRGAQEDTAGAIQAEAQHRSWEGTILLWPHSDALCDGGWGGPR